MLLIPCEAAQLAFAHIVESDRLQSCHHAAAQTSLVGLQRVAIVELAQQVGAFGVDVGHAHPAEAVALVEDVDRGPVGHSGNHQLGKLTQRSLDIE